MICRLTQSLPLARSGCATRKGFWRRVKCTKLNGLTDVLTFEDLNSIVFTVGGEIKKRMYVEAPLAWEITGQLTIGYRANL